MIEQFPRYSLDVFFAAHEPTERPDPNPAMFPTLTEAELIFGVDLSTGSQFLVYGRELLQTIARGGMVRAVKGIVVEIDQDKPYGELERLCALVQVIKGHDDFSPSETIEEGDDEE